MKSPAAPCLLFLFFHAMMAWGQAPATQPLVLSPMDPGYHEQKYDLAPYIDVLVDSSGILGIDDVVSAKYASRFNPDTGRLLTTVGSDLRGDDIAYIWARLSVRSDLEEMLHWVINISAEDAEVYIRETDGSFAHRVSGCGLKMSEKDLGGTYGSLAGFPFELLPGEEKDYYFRLSGIGYYLESPFHLAVFSKESFIQNERRAHAYSLFIYGILLAIAGYQFFLFAFQRKRVNLYLGGFILSMTILSCTYTGIITEIIAPELQPNFGYVAIAWGLSFLFFYLFSRQYLELGRQLPSTDRKLALLALVMFTERLIVGLIFFIQVKLVYVNFYVIHGLKTISFTLLVVMLIILVRSAIKLKSRGFAPANLYLVGMAVFLLSFFNKYLQAYTGFSFLPDETPVDIEQIILVIVFSLASARQVKLMEDARIKAETALSAEYAEHRRVREIDAFKSRFFTNISHEFRTPLTVILGMAEQIRAQPTTWAQKGSKMIRENGSRLLNLINQIMDLSKLEARAMRVNLVHQDVISFARYLAESIRSKAQQKSVQVQFHAEPESIEMDMDTDKLSKILTNLLDNAIRFTPAGGHIHFTISKHQNGNEEVIFEISDDGIGIALKDQERIFDRYYQVPDGKGGDNGYGSGVGLALTKELIHLLGGSVSVQSSPGEGSVFTVRLPIRHESASETPEAPRVPPGIFNEAGVSKEPDNGKESGKQTILVVEDSPDVITYITSLLAPAFQVISAPNGEEGLKAARELIPDLIITDMMMPVMDGLEMCAHLKRDIRTNHIPIIALTAKADLDSRLIGLETGVDAYLAKPFHKEELLVRIRNLIKQRDLLQERYRDFNFIFSDRRKGIQQQDHEEQFLGELSQLVSDHISDTDFGIPDLCRVLGMSRSQLYRKFKALTGRSIGEFIRTIRLERARHLLETTDLNISQVALESGFKNLSHFSKAFKKVYGISPTEIPNTPVKHETERHLDILTNIWDKGQNPLPSSRAPKSKRF